MKAILERVRREPVLVTTLVQTTLILLAAFGIDLSPQQMAAVLGVSGALLAIFARQQVTPTIDVGASAPGPDEPLEAGPAADVPTGKQVDVVPADAEANDGQQDGGPYTPHYRQA